MDDDGDILKAAGEALYGRRWQTPLARDLGVTDRTIRNWAGGVNRPIDLATRIIPLLRARREQLTHIIALAERLQNR
jgi:DNA-binding XRE family transcriptional regulator